jgi:hypothetical protein
MKSPAAMQGFFILETLCMSDRVLFQSALARLQQQQSFFLT